MQVAEQILIKTCLTALLYRHFTLPNRYLRKAKDEIEQDENVTHWDDYNACEIPSDHLKQL